MKNHKHVNSTPLDMIPEPRRVSECPSPTLAHEAIDKPVEVNTIDSEFVQQNCSELSTDPKAARLSSKISQVSSS